MTGPSVATLKSFFDDTYRILVRFVHHRTGDFQVAEEIAADCIHLAIEKGILDRPWVFRTAQNKVGDHLRKRRREQRMIDAISTHDQATYGVSETDDVVGAALALLAARDRELLVMTYWDELPDTEIAAVLGLSVAAVWKRRSRAKSRLRGLLGADSSEGTSGMEVVAHAMD